MKRQPPSIVDAWIENKQLVLLSPEFDRLTVPLARLSKLLRVDGHALNSFEIDPDGRFLHWPEADAHLGWDQFLQIVDPTAALARQQQSARFNEKYGAAIRALREEHGLKQSEIIDVTERHLRRVEHGQQMASRKMLAALAQAHEMPLDKYMGALAERMTQAH